LFFAVGFKAYLSDEQNFLLLIN